MICLCRDCFSLYIFLIFIVIYMEWGVVNVYNVYVYELFRIGWNLVIEILIKKIINMFFWKIIF